MIARGDIPELSSGGISSIAVAYNISSSFSSEPKVLDDSKFGCRKSGATGAFLTTSPSSERGLVKEKCLGRLSSLGVP
jgi:hypothetical protein